MRIIVKIISDATMDMLRKEAGNVKLDIHQDERGVTIYGRYEDKAVRRCLCLKDCVILSETNLINTLIYIVRDINYELTYCEY